MNNLLQSLSNQRLRLHIHDNDLKRLLSQVKDRRGHDAKLQDAFYDSLEGVLLDLRTVTIDNRDAEAFLKPVSKTDYPDYYEIIKEPMDLQTMLRKVKQKQYKSKAEFQDDLELIWSNCFVYNTGDNHPLRQCATRLKAKANRLLKNITDRRDRLDPPVPRTASSPGTPADVGTSVGVNGVSKMNGVVVNGYGPGHSRKHSGTGQKLPLVIKRSAPSSRMTSLAPPSPSPSTPPPPPPPATAPASTTAASTSTLMGPGSGSGSTTTTVIRREAPKTFGDQPAFVRSAAGMSAWATLDRELEKHVEALNSRLHDDGFLGPEVEQEKGQVDADNMNVDASGAAAGPVGPASPVAGPSRSRDLVSHPDPLMDKLRQVILSSFDDASSDHIEYEEREDYTTMNGVDSVDGEVGIGEKRKLASLNGTDDAHGRHRKRARTGTSTRLRLSLPTVDGDRLDDVDPLELWWDASTSSTLMSNALPILTYPSSSCIEPPPPSLSLPNPPPHAMARTRSSKRKTRKRKRKPREDDLESGAGLAVVVGGRGGAGGGKEPPRSLLGLINNNIRTLRRVRQIHDKFLALNLSSGDDNASTTGGSTLGPALPPPPAPGLALLPRAPSLPPLPGPSTSLSTMVSQSSSLDGGGPSKPSVEIGPEPEHDPLAVDDRPWRSRGVAEFGVSGLDLGERDATDCLRWMGMKVLEHSGFQSTSKSALDVFTGVATEYLFNVGRTLRYLCDKYSRKMSAEEIILHTLFESGITHIRDLERYITEDVMRYGTKLTELEKKMANAYNEVAVESALDDDAFFNEDEEEDNELVMGNFADAFGDDFLGLRELGIASELGLQSLTIPKKLLRSKNKQRDAQKGTKPSEPPPPYPPPPPFTPLDSLRVDNQIGLLRSFYINRVNTYAQKTHPHQPPPFVQPPAPQPSQLEIELAREMGTEPPVVQAPPPTRNPVAPLVVLPDDPPPTGRTKSGPLGQIMRPSVGGGTAAKKKVKRSGSGAGSGGAGGGGSGNTAGGGSAGGGGGGPKVRETATPAPSVPVPPLAPGPVAPPPAHAHAHGHGHGHAPVQATAPVYGYPMQMQMSMHVPMHMPMHMPNGTTANFSVPLHGPPPATGHGHEPTFVVLPGSAGVHPPQPPPPPSTTTTTTSTMSTSSTTSGDGKKSPRKKSDSGGGGGGGGGSGSGGSSGGMPQFVGVGVNA